MNKRKNQTTKLTKLTLPHNFKRKSTLTNLIQNRSFYAEQAQPTITISEILEELLSNTFNNVNYCHQICQELQKYQKQETEQQSQYFQLNSIELGNNIHSYCEKQPAQTTDPSCKASDKIKITTKAQPIPLLVSPEKPKSRSCDYSNDIQKYIDKHKAVKQRLKLFSNNSLLPLLTPNRNSQDHSEEIQQLLRRKKQLQLLNLKTERLNTQFSKRSARELKSYYQSDEGRAFDININPKNFDLNKSTVGEAKYLPDSTVTEGIKKRTILELIAPKKKKKRRQDINLGDTCVLIEQIKQNEPQKDLTTSIQSLLSKNVKLKLAATIHYDQDSTKHLRLPSVR